MRDFDQTVIGNPAYDLIRLGLSLASAARGSDLSGVVTFRMLDEVTAGYRNAFLAFDHDRDLKSKWPKSVKTAFRAAVDGTWKTMAKENIEDVNPAIPLGKRFWPLSKNEKQEISELFRQDKVRRLVTSLRRRDDDSPVAVHDAAFWVKGCSSLGNLRYAVLIGIGKKHPEYCIIDIKEAVMPVASKLPGTSIPKDNAERVASGAWHMSPALGTRILASSIQGRPVFLRELLPQDLKFEIENLEQKEALRVAGFLGAVIGKAHARQMDVGIRKKWLSQLSREGADGVASWLWSSVVQLLVVHEDGYLKHCRAVAERLHG